MVGCGAPDDIWFRRRAPRWENRSIAGFYGRSEDSDSRGKVHTDRIHAAWAKGEYAHEHSAGKEKRATLDSTKVFHMYCLTYPWIHRLL